MIPDFVRRAGTGFTLAGQSYRVAGANNYYLGFESDAMVQPVFDLAKRLGLNALRTWAFNDCKTAVVGTAPCFQYFDQAAGHPAYNDGPNGFERLDRTIAMAEQADIRLILPLVNYWPDFGGVDQYLEWFGLTGRDQFYTDPSIRNAYRNYAEHVLLRVNAQTGRQYRDEPAILAWELMNEPRCTRNGGVEILLGWVSEMSAFLRSLDPNHLIGVGDEGYFKHNFAFGNTLYNGTFGVDCERLLGIGTVDFGTCHLYPDYSAGEDAGAFGTRWIREHIEAGQRANKPMLIEEYGVKIDAGQAARDDAFRAWLNQVQTSDGAGALLWMIAGPGYPDYDRYTVYG